MNVHRGLVHRPTAVELGRRLLTTDAVRWIALLALCAPYLQGGLYKATHFSAAVAEMEGFGLSPAAAMAVLVIIVELGGSALILSGRLRWLGTLALAGFTFMATLMAYSFWNMAPPERVPAMNAFFEHIGLIGGFLLVAWHDLATSKGSTETL